MIPSPKVKKHLKEIKNEQWTTEELRELLKAIARDFKITIEITEEAHEEDFWELSPVDEQRFDDLLHKSTKDLKDKRYTEYDRS